MGLLARVFRPALPWLRLGAFVCVVGVALVALGLRRVRADVLEAGLAMGETLEGLGDVLPRPYVVWMNGQRAYVASATLDAPPSVALDRVEGLCRSGDGGLVRDLAERAARAGFEPPHPGEALPVPGLLRKDGPRGGVVGCLVHDHALGLGEVTERLGRVARDGDLAHLGHLRYASARPTKHGGTHLVVVWTSDAFVPSAAFPRTGDAPGADLANVSRPSGARRILAATVEGAPYGVRIYHAPEASPDDLREAYAHELLRGGFTKDVLARPVDGQSYRRGAEDLVVRASPARGGGALLSVVSLGQAGRVAP